MGAEVKAWEVVDVLMLLVPRSEPMLRMVLREACNGGTEAEKHRRIWSAMEAHDPDVWDVTAVRGGWLQECRVLLAPDRFGGSPDQREAMARAVEGRFQEALDELRLVMVPWSEEGTSPETVGGKAKLIDALLTQMETMAAAYKFLRRSAP